MTIEALPQVIAVTDVMESHVNCRCTMVPRAKSYAELVYPDEVDRAMAEMNGDLPPDNRPAQDTGAQAFAKLHPTIQRQILGPGKFALYQRGLPLDAMWERTYSAQWGVSRTAKPLWRLQRDVASGKYKLRTPDAIGQLDLWADPREFGGGEELKDWAGPVWRNANLTQGEKDALASYKGAGYRYVNEALRYGDTHSDVPALDSALAKTVLPQAVRTYRGAGTGSAFGVNTNISTRDDIDTLLSNWVGREWSDPGYVSTAALREHAFSGIQMVLDVPAGHPAFPYSEAAIHSFAGASEYVAEAELLLPRGTRVIIDRVVQDESFPGSGRPRWTLYGRVLPYQKP